MYLTYLAAAQKILCAKRGPNKKRGPQCSRGLGKGLAVAAILLGLMRRQTPEMGNELGAGLGDTTRLPIGLDSNTAPTIPANAAAARHSLPATS